ncbi:MAG: MCE family protein [Terrimonas sp.]|nr:MCE family protein [Terrimonas sp.]
MANRKINNIRLGIFVLAGLCFLILGLYFIGKDENIFGASFRLKANFENASGLVPGNNVLYAGIQVGTVKKVNLINDTLIEVVMSINEKAKKHIRKNALASIGTEGFIGNKIVNILPGEGPATFIEENDIISAKKAISTDDMLETLAVSNRNIADITVELKTAVQRINYSTAIWKLLNDETLPSNIRATVENLRSASAKANSFVASLQSMAEDVKAGKGSLGQLVTDTSIARQLYKALEKINAAGDQAEKLAGTLQQMTAGIDQDINNGKGIAHSLLKDSLVVLKLNSSLDNIEKGTRAFNENMEALKNNFLFRGYFKKLEKQKKVSKKF